MIQPHHEKEILDELSLDVSRGVGDTYVYSDVKASIISKLKEQGYPVGNPLFWIQLIMFVWKIWNLLMERDDVSSDTRDRFVVIGSPDGSMEPGIPKTPKERRRRRRRFF